MKEVVWHFGLHCVNELIRSIDLEEVWGDGKSAKEIFEMLAWIWQKIPGNESEKLGARVGKKQWNLKERIYEKNDCEILNECCFNKNYMD